MYIKMRMLVHFFFLYLAHAQHRKNAFTQNHFFSTFLSYFREKSPIRETKENSIIEGMPYLFV